MPEARPNYFPHNLSGDLRHWFTQFLIRMDEPPFYSAASYQPLTIRLLCLPTWSEPCSIRLQSSGLSFHLWGRELDGEAGFDVGRLVRREERLLTGQDAAQVWELWRYLRFWSLAESDPESEVFDGTTYVLEAAERSRYHLIHRDELDWCHAQRVR
jgi:hypothetical protein